MSDKFFNKVFESGRKRVLGDEKIRERSKSPTNEEEALISTREVARSGELLGGGIGSARFIQLKDDGGAVFKPHSKYEKERAMIFSGRERAAYLVDRFLGFNFVPPTVIRSIGDETGSLQEFVSDFQSAWEVQKDQISKEELLKLKIFDFLINNDDRNNDNYLVKNGKIFAIDNGIAFYLEDAYKIMGLTSVQNDPIPLELRQSFKKFIEWPEGVQLLKELLAELLGDEIADAYVKRISAFIETIDDQGRVTEERLTAALKSKFKQ